MARNPLGPPPFIKQESAFDKWMRLLWQRVVDTGQILWSQLDFTGSNLTDIATRNHADLQNLNTASYTHLTAANHTDLTDGGATTLHKHDHGGMDGLADDDHTQYILANGTRALSADWDAGSFEIRAQTFESDVTTGTAPLVVASTTKVTNLNADLLDDQSGTYYLDSANFTGTNWTDLTDSGETTLHTHAAQDYKPGGTDVALADGGTGASLSDPNADRIMFWDDSAGSVTWLTIGTNLSITDTTISATGGGSDFFSSGDSMAFAAAHG